MSVVELRHVDDENLGRRLGLRSQGETAECRQGGQELDGLFHGSCDGVIERQEGQQKPLQ